MSEEQKASPVDDSEESAQAELDERVVFVNRCSKVVKGITLFFYNRPDGFFHYEPLSASFIPLRGEFSESINYT